MRLRSASSRRATPAGKVASELQSSAKIATAALSAPSSRPGYISHPRSLPRARTTSPPSLKPPEPQPRAAKLPDAPIRRRAPPLPRLGLGKFRPPEPSPSFLPPPEECPEFGDPFSPLPQPPSSSEHPSPVSRASHPRPPVAITPRAIFCTRATHPWMRSSPAVPSVPSPDPRAPWNAGGHRGRQRPATASGRSRGGGGRRRRRREKVERDPPGSRTAPGPALPAWISGGAFARMRFPAAEAYFPKRRFPFYQSGTCL